MSRYISQTDVFSGQVRAEPQATSVSWYANDWEIVSETRRWPVVVAWVAVVILALWVVGATGYIIFHDDLVKNVVRDRVRMQTAYEDRITRLRSEVDSINSRLMLNQDDFDTKLDALRRRQSILENRQEKLSQLADLGRHPALVAAERQIAGADADDAPATGRSSSNEIRLTFAQRTEVASVARPAAATLTALGLPQTAQNEAEHALIRLAESQHRLETEQNETLTALETRAATARKLVASTIIDLGFAVEDVTGGTVRTAETVATDPTEPVGGPFVPMVLTGSAEHTQFDDQITSLREELGETAAMFDGLLTLPVRRPLSFANDITSGFGMRTDPFIGSLAMHAGIDFQADSGTPVRATANGRVVEAKRNGGYGNMVDIEHESGLTTRYAHLSSIGVSAGDHVRVGDVIGRVGSTGRSTGPHLHYETRLNGDPINPIRFIRAGDIFLQR